MNILNILAQVTTHTKIHSSVDNSIFEKFGIISIIAFIVIFLISTGITVLVIVLIVKSVKKHNARSQNIKKALNPYVSCDYCGASIEKGNTTCPNCGAAININKDEK